MLSLWGCYLTNLTIALIEFTKLSKVSMLFMTFKFVIWAAHLKWRSSPQFTTMPHLFNAKLNSLITPLFALALSIVKQYILSIPHSFKHVSNISHNSSPLWLLTNMKLSIFFYIVQSLSMKWVVIIIWVIFFNKVTML